MGLSNRKKLAVMMSAFGILLVAVAVTALGGKWTTTTTEQDKEEGAAEIVFFGLTDADSILLRQGEHTILIDTGEEKDGKYLIQSLQKKGITKIDYLILTHPDKDHIGGASQILDVFPVGTVIQSFFEKGSERQARWNEKLKEKNIEPWEPKEVQQVDCGEFQCTIYPPEKEHYKKDNNYSLMVLVKHGEVNMLFAGDALKKRLKEAMAYDLPQIDLYKVSHHGRENALSGEFLRKIAPRYAVITSDQGDEELLAELEALHTSLYFTDKGDVRFFSDGEQVYPVM